MVAGSGAARRASVAHEAAENCRTSSRARCLEWPLVCAKLAGRGSLGVARWSRIHGDAPCATLADHCRCCCATTPHAGHAPATQEAAEEALLVERKAPHVGRAMRDCAALVARKICWRRRRCRPAAAPTKLRRCRDGWSDFV
ncbi:hypothetical protein F511_45989 [Dorcoceras hygrometricum]|uniref:Uncharacterized protein n=1 Tax=Dorcoceras hygrometricum TaxID=472368 RepID=A0A2Z6ZUM2_9LAMI|nr:hypothetical protein F511_45989 [Dorcoceras hygrometricum]